jgi:two-component system sensor histidine kinase/response regulator
MLHLDWRFLPVFDAIDPASAYPGTYSAGLVGLSVLVAALAAFVALSISDRIEAAGWHGARWAWASAGATAMGGGIWGMHFIGMLAFSLPCGVSYDPVGTVVSMIPGILASGVALHVISRRSDPGFGLLTLGAVFMGAGIGLMHYWGMAAMEPDALLRYDPLLVAVSVVVAVVLAFLSLNIRFSFHRLHSSRMLATLVAAPVMGCAVAGMHYTAMEASIFFPVPAAPFAKLSASPMFLATLITIFIVLIMAITLVATFAGRQVELAQNLAAEIAERKRTEEALIAARQQAEAANRAKSQFLATMSHEIRTPMNGVLGTANLLAATPLNERQSQLAQNLVRSGQTLLGIINDILDLSKIEAGRFEVIAADFDPRELVAEVTDLFCERCTNKGLEFVYFIAQDVPRRLRGDVARLRQVLINLVGNAMKFTESGEILIELTVAQSPRDRIMLRTSVKDTGIGIAAEHQARIFDSFHQIDGSTTRARGGTGLGLSIVKELVKLMGGEVGVESHLGRGSRFWFNVPLDLVQQDGASARELERPLRVLIADSNAVSAEIMQRYFDSWRIEAETRSSVAEAEAAWRAAAGAQHPFDVAIIDVKGFGCSGVSLARTMLAAQTAAATEVILLVGLDGSVADSSLESVGAYALLTKPPRPSVLFDCLASIASGARQNGVASFYLRKSGTEPSIAFDGHVLVVEDNPVNQDVATGILENMGCSVVTAPNGAAAINRCATESFDLVLMDCEMPVMDGFEATKRLREMERVNGGLRGSGQSRSRLPIVALTAHALAEVRQQCLDAGMDDFLVKPFDEQQMVEMLGRWLTPRDVTDHHDAAPNHPDEAPDEQDEVIAKAPSTGSSHALDMAAIDKIRAIGGSRHPALLHGVVTRFAETSPPIVAIIREKSGEADMAGVWHAAHNLKSSAAALGARVVTQLCSDIETRARDEDTLPSDATITLLEVELKTATRQLLELAAADAAAV